MGTSLLFYYSLVPLTRYSVTDSRLPFLAKQMEPSQVSFSRGEPHIIPQPDIRG